MEVLLSYFEMRQYEKYAMDKLNINPNEVEHIDETIQREFPENVPLSNIIYSYENDENKKSLSNELKLKNICYELYLKYVKRSSKFEININYGMRQTLSYLLNDRNVWLNNDQFSDLQLCTIFDGCCREMYVLMGYALSRAKFVPSVAVPIQN